MWSRQYALSALDCCPSQIVRTYQHLFHLRRRSMFRVSILRPSALHSPIYAARLAYSTTRLYTSDPPSPSPEGIDSTTLNTATPHRHTSISYQTLKHEASQDPTPDGQMTHYGRFLREWSEQKAIDLRQRTDAFVAGLAASFAQIGGQLNRVTGYNEIDALKRRVVDQGTSSHLARYTRAPVYMHRGSHCCRPRSCP